MTWLVRGDEVLCPLEVAQEPAARVVGLLGRNGIDGALLIPGCRSVHTLGMRFPIDVAFLNRKGKVVAVVAPMRRWRLGRMRVRGTQVVEAEAGMFDRWHLAVGDVLQIADPIDGDGIDGNERDDGDGNGGEVVQPAGER